MLGILREIAFPPSAAAVAFRDRVRIILYWAIERKNAFSSFFVKEREKKSFLFERKVKKGRWSAALLPNFIKVPYLASYCYRVIEGTDGL